MNQGQIAILLMLDYSSLADILKVCGKYSFDELINLGMVEYVDMDYSLSKKGQALKNEILHFVYHNPIINH